MSILTGWPLPGCICRQCNFCAAGRLAMTLCMCLYACESLINVSLSTLMYRFCFSNVLVKYREYSVPLRAHIRPSCGVRRVVWHLRWRRVLVSTRICMYRRSSSIPTCAQTPIERAAFVHVEPCEARPLNGSFSFLPLRHCSTSHLKSCSSAHFVHLHCQSPSILVAPRRCIFACALCLDMLTCRSDCPPLFILLPSSSIQSF